jgi:hypothetical protein
MTYLHFFSARVGAFAASSSVSDRADSLVLPLETDEWQLLMYLSIAFISSELPLSWSIGCYSFLAEEPDVHSIEEVV